jgi:ribosome biogenesis protein ERB1
MEVKECAGKRRSLVLQHDSSSTPSQADESEDAVRKLAQADPFIEEGAEDEEPYDSEDGLEQEEDEDLDGDNDDEGVDDEDEDEEFEEQGSSDTDELLEQQEGDEEPEEGIPAKKSLVRVAEKVPRIWAAEKGKPAGGEQAVQDLDMERSLHVDDLSSDDEDGAGLNTIGRIPLHWYDEFDHIGYDVRGKKVMKEKGADRIDLALARRDDPAFMRTVYDGEYFDDRCGHSV